MMFNYKKFLNLFRFRGDTFAIQTSKGDYIRMYKPPTKEDLERHLKYQKVIALYPVMNDMTYIGVLDFDIPKALVDDPDAKKQVLGEVKECWEMLDDLGIKSKLLETTGGRGWHIWVFSELVQSAMMYTFLRRIVETVDSSAEIFPINENGLGKPIRLPLGTHKVYKGKSTFLHPEGMFPIKLTNNMLDELYNERVTQEFLESIGVYKLTDSGCQNYENFNYNDIPKIDDFDEILKSIRPCFREVYLNKIETENGDGWNFMTAAAAEILANGGSAEHCHKYFSAQNQYNRQTTTKNLKPIMRKNLYPFSCKRLQEVCGDIVGQFCPSCHIHYHDRLNETLENAVDRTENKEIRREGTVKDTLKQFDAVAFEMDDILTHTGYTVLSNTFNGGKSWATIRYIEHVVHKLGKRVNFIMPHRNIKNKMVSRMEDAKINFMDIPSSLDLCLFADKYRDIGYVPSDICKKCFYYAPLKNIMRPLTDKYVEESESGFFGTIQKYREIAIEMDICPKWIFLGLLMSTIEENLCLLTTSKQISHQMFLEDTPLFSAMASPQTHVNVIDQIDFVNRNVPRLTLYEDDLIKYMGHLGIFYDTNNMFKTRINAEHYIEQVDNGEIELTSNLDYIACDYIKTWMKSEDKYDQGIYRKSYSDLRPDIIHYEFMGENLVKMIMNDNIMNKFNVYLYDNLIEYLKHQHIECVNGQEHVPLSFKTVLENITGCDTVLGITSTSGEMENLNDTWISSYHNKLGQVLKNLYSLPNHSQEYISEDAAFVYTRKNDGENYINNGLVRGDTCKMGRKQEVFINDLQFPKQSEQIISDIIHLCGGNIGKGIKIFYENIINDAITQAHEYDVDKIIVPNTDLFVTMGFHINGNDDVKLIEAYDEFKRIYENNKKPTYRANIKTISDEMLDKLVKEGMIKMKGKKYVLGDD